MIKQINVLFLLFCSLTGQSLIDYNILNKCGLIPSNENQLYRIDQNWGYSYDSLLVDLERWGNSPYVNIDSIGATVQNRALWEITISNFPDSNTLPRVYIHTRTHPSEEESFWVSDEIINLLLSDSPYAEFVRNNTVFHIIPMYNPDGVELGFSRENANGIDIESGWDDVTLEPEVAVLKNRFIELMATNNPVEVALNMHSAYSCVRYFVYHAAGGTTTNYTILEQQFINDVRSYFPNGFEPWDYFVSWNSGTPDQYPESWWWMTHGENVLALTYEDMNCAAAGAFDSTANAIVRGVVDYLGLEYVGTNENLFTHPGKFSLIQNYPNPFNPTTTIQFILSKASNVNISIFDLSGHEIIHLVRENLTSGSKSVKWDGTDKSGIKVPSGIYFYSISTGNFRQTRKMVLLK